jgi:phosphoserine phosphatase RsbX
VGNVDGVLLRERPAPTARTAEERLIPRGGVVGHHLPPLDASTLRVARGDTLVLATDGLRDGFAEDLKRGDEAGPMAELILARHAKRTDDALVVVARYLGDSR